MLLAEVAKLPIGGRLVAARSEAAAAAVELVIGGEPDVRSCAGTVIGADADDEGGTDTEAGRAALIFCLGEGCECETDGGFVGAEALAVDAATFEVLARGPKVLRDEDVYGSS